MRTETKELKIYNFDELSDKAKKNAIDTHSQFLMREYDNEHIYDWMYAVLECLGYNHSGSDITRDRRINIRWAYGGQQCIIRLPRDMYEFTRPPTDAKTFAGECGDVEMQAARDRLEEAWKLRQDAEDLVCPTGDWDYDAQQKLLDEAEDKTALACETIEAFFAQVFEDDYEDCGSDEAALESIKANGYEYLEDGSIY